MLDDQRVHPKIRDCLSNLPRVASHNVEVIPSISQSVTELIDIEIIAGVLPKQQLPDASNQIMARLFDILQLE